MVSEYEGNWLLVTPVYPLRRGHGEYPAVARDGPTTAATEHSVEWPARELCSSATQETRRAVLQSSSLGCGGGSSCLYVEWARSGPRWARGGRCFSGYRPPWPPGNMDCL